MFNSTAAANLHDLRLLPLLMLIRRPFGTVVAVDRIAPQVQLDSALRAILPPQRSLQFMHIATDTIAVVLAGGVGSRLAPLTADRAKPAVPFGGQYRIIDFTLSNCLHSGLRRILALTQYKSQSLQKHLQDAWSIFNPELDEYVTAVPPQLRTGDFWYRGTADAIHQNLYLLNRSAAKYVMILSGDHVYRMNYSEMLERHRASAADVTVGCMEVGLDEARAFGVMSVDGDRRIRDFKEKPQHPRAVPGRPNRALASMGIYVFTMDALCEELERDSRDTRSTHDFGKDILPRMIHTHRVCEHRFGETNMCPALETYWRDVGTLDSYFQANMDLLKHQPAMELSCACWPIRKHERPAPPARIERDSFGVPGVVTDSLISNGVRISGGVVSRSILSTNVQVSSGAVVDDSILFDDVQVGEGVRLNKCIIDKGVAIPAGESIGLNRADDAERFTVSEDGVVVVPKDYRFSKARKNVPRPQVRLPSESRMLTKAY